MGAVVAGLATDRGLARGLQSQLVAQGVYGLNSHLQQIAWGRAAWTLGRQIHGQGINVHQPEPVLGPQPAQETGLPMLTPMRRKPHLLPVTLVFPADLHPLPERTV